VTRQQKRIFTGLAVAAILAFTTVITCPNFSKKDPIIENTQIGQKINQPPINSRSNQKKRRTRNNRTNDSTTTIPDIDTELIELIERTYSKSSIDCQEIRGTKVDDTDDASYYLRYPPLKGELPIRYQNIEYTQLEDRIRATDTATLMRIIDHLAKIGIVTVYDGLAIARPNEYLNNIIARRNTGEEISYDLACLRRSSNATVALVTALKERLLRSIDTDEDIGQMIRNIPENIRPVMHDQLIGYLFGCESELETEQSH